MASPFDAVNRFMAFRDTLTEPLANYPQYIKPDPINLDVNADWGPGGGGGGGDTAGGLVTYPGFTGRVNAGLARALAQAEKMAGVKITGGGGRTYAQQVALHRAKPGLAAEPGRSLHEESNGALAIDVKNWRDPRVRNALRAVGFRQFDARKEPWHFSWGPKVG